MVKGDEQIFEDSTIILVRNSWLQKKVTFVEMSVKRSLPLILWASNVVYYFDGQTQTVSF